MSELQSTIEFSVELYKFYNVDLFQRGMYQIRCSLRILSKLSAEIEVTTPDATTGLGTAVVLGNYGACRPFQILYRNEEVTLKDVVLFRCHTLVDGNNLKESLERLGFTLCIELWFSETSPVSMAMVSSRNLQLNLLPMDGLHYHLPVLFDYFHLSAISVTIHAVLTALHQPSMKRGILRYMQSCAPKSSKSWSKIRSAHCSSLTDPVLTVTSHNKIYSRINESPQIHLEARDVLLESSNNLRITIKEYRRLFVERDELLKENYDTLTVQQQKSRNRKNSFTSTKSDTNNSLAEICADNIRLWNYFLLNFSCKTVVQQHLSKKHHELRVRRFAELFFFVYNPRTSAIGRYDNTYQRYLLIAEIAKRSKYMQLLPPLPVHCPALDGDNTMMPIIFEDQYQSFPSTEENSFKRSRTLNNTRCSCGVETLWRRLPERYDPFDGAPPARHSKSLDQLQIYPRTLFHYSFGDIVAENQRRHCNTDTIPPPTARLKTVSSEHDMRRRHDVVVRRSSSMQFESPVRRHVPPIATNGLPPPPVSPPSATTTITVGELRKARSAPLLDGRNENDRRPVAAESLPNLVPGVERFVLPETAYLTTSSSSSSEAASTTSGWMTSRSSSSSIEAPSRTETRRRPRPAPNARRKTSRRKSESVTVDEMLTLPPPMQFRDMESPSTNGVNDEDEEPTNAVDNLLYHVVDTTLFSKKHETKSKSADQPYGTNRETYRAFVKARNEFKSQLNFPGILYSDLTTYASTIPYFHISDEFRIFSPEGMHLIVCVHGLDGNSADLRLVKTYLELGLPGAYLDFLMSERNQGDTFSDFDTMTDRLVSEILHYLDSNTIRPTRISFVGHSLGTVIIRSALTRPQMKFLLPRLHTFLSLSGPHLGTLYNSSGLVNMGMWFMQKWKRSGSLLQLCMKDSNDARQSFLYRLSQKSTLHHFRNVLLCGSGQDRYVPLHSARIELCKESMKDQTDQGAIYREMVHNIISPMIAHKEVNLVRYDVHHALPNTANALIGRAAHIAVLDSELFIEKFMAVVGIKYFR